MEHDRTAILERSTELRKKRPFRTLIVASHPVQYASPIFRRLAKDPRVEIQVAYCSLRGAEAHVDPEFGVEVKWDVPLLDGYSWMEMPNHSPVTGTHSFLSLCNPQVWRLIRSRKFDAVILYTGYMCMTFWIAILACKLMKVPVLFGTDAHVLSSLDQKKWKFWVKRFAWPYLFRLANIVIVPSSGGLELMKRLGIPSSRVVVTPYVVDNEWWAKQHQSTNRRVTRAGWNIPDEALVILFAAKLQPWKRPLDVLRAFAQARCEGAYLVFAGEGPLRDELESETKTLGQQDRVRFLGFVNQSSLPDIYSACDILVLPSEYDAFGVVVNEAMLCGCCVIVSDHVGARFDLIREGQTGFTFPTGDTDALANLLKMLATGRERITEISECARAQMEKWSPIDNINSTVEALERASAQ